VGLRFAAAALSPSAGSPLGTAPLLTEALTAVAAVRRIGLLTAEGAVLAVDFQGLHVAPLARLLDPRASASATTASISTGKGPNDPTPSPSLVLAVGELAGSAAIRCVGGDDEGTASEEPCHEASNGSNALTGAEGDRSTVIVIGPPGAGTYRFYGV
jgi:hypothetical protein